MRPLLEARDLCIRFRGQSSNLIQGVSLSVDRGETLALVGESGSGKTLTCRALMKILPPAASITSGEIRLTDSAGDVLEITGLRERAIRAVRGGRFAMIFQEPMSSLSPLHTIGSQTAEMLRLHGGGSARGIKRRCLEKFERVGFPDPERAWRSYPFEMSGGLRQRAMIAMAMIAGPELLIADEPTTALDVTTQAQVLGLIKDLQAETDMGVVIVTHDLGVVANVADRVAVMRKGKIVEAGETSLVVGAPAHGYTRMLVAAAPKIPEMMAKPPPETPDPILELRDVRKTYVARRGAPWRPASRIRALRGVDLTMRRGATFAIVGESGSGKSTLERIALAAERPDRGGEVRYTSAPGATPVSPHGLRDVELKAFRRDAQMVFQDPYAALSPRMRVLEILCEPLDIHRIGARRERREKAADLLEQVGLDPTMALRYPHAFSGGQRQRIAIARALALSPKLLVLDEPTSALDVSVQAQMLDLLERIRDERGLSYLFVSHDLAVVARLADDVAVMRQGVIVEQGPAAEMFNNPRHPYTRALIEASPEPNLDKRIDLKAVARGAGGPAEWPEPFGYSGDQPPPLREAGPGHLVRIAA